MAKDKKSFVLYSDSQGLINQLPDDVAGRLLKHIYSYVNDENPITDELLINVAFEPIKMQFKRDLIKWESTKEVRSIAGKASAEARKLLKENQQTLTNSTNVNLVQQTSTNLTVNDNVNVNVINNNNSTSIKVDWSALINQFNSITGKNTKVISPIVKTKILARLKEGYSKQDFLNAIENCYNDKWHKETNHKHLTLEFISRADKLERFSTQKL
jgi:uncharacterized phage protein (TIGR02220 family)